MPRLVIHAIDCKVHSSGVDAGVLEALKNAVLAGAKVGEASAVFTGIGDALAAGGKLIEGIVNLVSAIDNAGDYPDQLYLSFSNRQRENKIWPQNLPYSEIRSGQIIRPNLTIPFSGVVDINFWEYDSVSADDFLGRLTVDGNHVGGIRYQIIARPLEGAIYLVVYSVDDSVSYAAPGTLIWHKHLGWQKGTTSWSSPIEVGNGWKDFKSVFATSNGVIYAIQTDGKLLWYRHPGYLSGPGGYSGPIEVGNGWANFKSVFATSNGVIYAIQTDGKLLWYRHPGYLSGPGGYSGPIEVGSGWANFKSVFATSDGIHYAIENDGTLWWYQHSDYLTGKKEINGHKVGSGWANFKSVFATSRGNIYAIRTDGTLVWYHHQGYLTGTVGIIGPIEVGTGWGGFKSVFATNDGVIYAISS
jgi:hypothetical protein